MYRMDRYWRVSGGSCRNWADWTLARKACLKLAGALVLTLMWSMNLLAQSDKQGCIDHPVITRYPGAVIEYCDTKNFSQFAIATGPETDYQKIDKWVNVSGKQTRIYYSLKGDKIVSEVYQNYLTALKNADFTLLANKMHQERNVSKEVGGNSWLSTFYKSNPFPSNVGIKINQGSGSLGGTFYAAGKKGGLYIAVSGKRYSDNETVVLLDVLETQEMEDKLISIDAKAMAERLKATGHIGLDNILFDFNAATIKDESKQVIDEIAKMLKDNPGFKLYVVGHTDMVGDLKYNMDLSLQRATAVVNHLVQQHGIAAARLSPQGVGPLSPVESNATEEGRSKNRRVELVLTDHTLPPK